MTQEKNNLLFKIQFHIDYNFITVHTDEDSYNTEMTPNFIYISKELQLIVKQLEENVVYMKYCSQNLRFPWKRAQIQFFTAG